MVSHRDNDFQCSPPTQKKPISVLDRVNSHSFSPPCLSKTNLTDADGNSINDKNDRINLSTKTTEGIAGTIETEKRVEHWIEVHKNAPVVRIKSTATDPLSNSYQDEDRIRGNRRPITAFTQRSRKNFLRKLGVINQGKISPNEVQFCTLTIMGYRSPYQCKKILNIWLTRLRKRLEGHKWFYAWRMENHEKLRDGKVQMHLHICIFGIKQLNHRWLRHSWSRCVLGYKEYKRICDSSDDPKEVFKRLVITDVEPARDWGECRNYFSKNLCAVLNYISKENDDESVELMKQNPDLKTGRWWGIGKYEMYNKFVDRLVYQINDSDWSALRRVFVQYIKSSWVRKHKEKFNHSMWKGYKRYLTDPQYTHKKKYKTTTIDVRNLAPEIWTFMDNYTMGKLLKCIFPDETTMHHLEPPNEPSFKSWISDRESMIYK